MTTLSDHQPGVNVSMTPPRSPSSEHPATTRRYYRAAVIQERGLDALRQIAAEMHARQRPAVEILAALYDHGELLAEAHGYQLHPMALLIRELPGLESFDPVAEEQAMMAERRRRAEVLSDWARRHAGTVAVEQVACLVEQWAAEGVLAASEVEDERS